MRSKPHKHRNMYRPFKQLDSSAWPAELPVDGVIFKKSRLHLQNCIKYVFGGPLASQHEACLSCCGFTFLDLLLFVIFAGAQQSEDDSSLRIETNSRDHHPAWSFHHVGSCKAPATIKRRTAAFVFRIESNSWRFHHFQFFWIHSFELIKKNLKMSCFYLYNECCVRLSKNSLWNLEWDKVAIKVQLRNDYSCKRSACQVFHPRLFKDLGLSLAIGQLDGFQTFAL